MPDTITAEELLTTYYKGVDALKNTRVQDAIIYAKRRYLPDVPSSEDGFGHCETPEGMVLLYGAHQLMSVEHFTCASTAYLLLHDVNTLAVEDPGFARQLKMVDLLMDMGPSTLDAVARDKYSLGDGYYRRLIHLLIGRLQSLRKGDSDHFWQVMVVDPQPDPALREYLVTMEKHVREGRVAIRDGRR